MLQVTAKVLVREYFIEQFHHVEPGQVIALKGEEVVVRFNNGEVEKFLIDQVQVIQ